MERFSFSFFFINEAAKEGNNQCYQGYDTCHSSTNDRSGIYRRGGFTCNNQNSKKLMALNVPCSQYGELVLCACVQGS